MKDSIINTFKVYSRDIRGIFKNPISILIISGLCIIPSLYSFLNVIACWDAYTNTSTVQIAVINNDTGAIIAGQHLNIGDSIVAQLKTNTQIGWTFVNTNEGNIGLSSGQYYAELIIPENFSKELNTLTTSNTPTKPELIYKVNTKLGPVANKITEVAQQNLISQIKGSIIQAISEQIFSKLNPYGDKLNKEKEQILQFKNSLVELNDNMGSILDSLTNVQSDSKNISTYITATKNILPLINQSLSGLSTNLNSMSTINTNINSILSNAFNTLNLNLNESMNNLNNIKNIINSENESSLTDETIKNILNNNFDQTKTNLINITNFLNGLPNNNKIKLLKTSLNKTLNSISTLKNILANTNSNNLPPANITNLNISLNNIIAELNTSINQMNDLKDNLNSINSNILSGGNSSITTLNNLQTLNGKINNLLASIDSSANLAASTSNNLSNYLNEYKSLIAELAQKLTNLNNNDLSQIISLLQGNPVIMSDYLQSPFIFKQESLYKVDNYGSGMTPVYSVLAFWVGILLLTSLLKIESPHFEGIENISIREKHFGKMLTFITIAIVQSLIIAIGAKFLLKVQVTNLPLFIFSSLLTAITFTIVIFTIVSMFRTIGKAIAIILMVVQLSGTGGTYPIQAMPIFFRIVGPYLPFPYGVDLMREAIAGPYAPNVFKDIRALALFCIIFILLGYFFKKPTLGFFNMFEANFHKSGLAEE